LEYEIFQKKCLDMDTTAAEVGAVQPGKCQLPLLICWLPTFLLHFACGRGDTIGIGKGKCTQMWGGLFTPDSGFDCLNLHLNGFGMGIGIILFTLSDPRDFGNLLEQITGWFDPPTAAVYASTSTITSLFLQLGQINSAGSNQQQQLRPIDLLGIGRPRRNRSVKPDSQRA
jgi:hypothetical protein